MHVLSLTRPKHYWEVFLLIKAENLRFKKLLKSAENIYDFPFERLLGEAPRLRIICGDFFGDFNINVPFSLSGDGELPPPDPEFLRDEPILTSK